MDDTVFTSSEGNPKGRTLLFIHGWPDDHRVWDRQVEYFAPNDYCVRVHLPNSGLRVDARAGYDFDEMTARIGRAIDELCEQRGVERIILIGHDWGAYLAYLVEQARPERIEKMVTMDIGGHIKVSSIKQAALICAYQWPLILAWLAGGIAPPVGNWLTQTVARGVGAPKGQRQAIIGSRQNYFYFYLWRGMLLPIYRKRLLRRYRPQCPLLYLYGLRKPLMFHSERWLQKLDEAPGCKHLGLDAGHWLMLDQPDQVNQEIEAFLKDSSQ